MAADREIFLRRFPELRFSAVTDRFAAAWNRRSQKMAFEVLGNEIQFSLERGAIGR